MAHNIVSIDSYRMQNSEFLGLMQKISVFAEKLSLNEIQPSVTTFKLKVKALEKALEVEFDESAAHQAQCYNNDRLAAYSALRYSVKGLTFSPIEGVSEAGAKYWHVIEIVDDPRCQNQDAITSTLRTLTHAFREFDAEEMARWGVLVHLEAIEACQAAFIKAAMLRGQKAESYVKKATRKKRKDCYEAFRLLIYYTFARAENNGDTECQDFVAQCNGELGLRKSQLKTRKTLATKKAEESENAEDNETAVAEVAANEATVNETVANEIAMDQIVAPLGDSDSSAKKAG